MYRQILLQVDERDLQRVLWRTLFGSIQAFCLNTVTYGLASAPFLAIRCLFHLALECQSTFPEASQVIKRDFYVDDLITGGNDLIQLKILKEDITKILRSGEFELHKWNSNEPSILHDNDGEITGTVNFEQEINTLSLIWNTKLDKFQYRINLKAQSSRSTKRVILSITFTPTTLAIENWTIQYRSNFIQNGYNFGSSYIGSSKFLYLDAHLIITLARPSCTASVTHQKLHTAGAFILKL